MSETVVYMLGLYHCFGELDIYGVYTDREKLYEKYRMLLMEDYICQEEDEKPLIFKLPLNTFIGTKMDWGYDETAYFDDLDKRKIMIEDLSREKL